MANGNDEDAVYRVHPEGGQFKVMAPSGQTVMACHDEGSVTHYVVLLNEAFQRGYKVGYREGRARGKG